MLFRSERAEPGSACRRVETVEHDNCGEIQRRHGPDAQRLGRYCAVRDLFYREIKSNLEYIMQCGSKEELHTAFSKKKIAASLTVEGGSVLGGRSSEKNK